MSIFSKTRIKRQKYSTFNLSHDRKMSLNMGNLVPCLVQECVPGDQWKINTQQMLRMMPMIAPVMHEVNVFTHFYFVPNRLMFDGWEDFITGGENGLDATLLPSVNLTTMQGSGLLNSGTLSDYLGLPTRVSPSEPLPVSALPFAAYNLIYDQYYRDQNLQTSTWDNIKEILDEGGSLNIMALQALRFFDVKKRAWQRDYFTSALPFAQKGNAVNIPIAGEAPIRWNQEALGGTKARDFLSGNLVEWDSKDPIHGDPNFPGAIVGPYGGVGDSGFNIDSSDKYYADLENASATTISDLRRAFKLQEWLEKNARAGSRYVESILSHFGVRSSDARLQRAEYLGGGMSPVMISEVLQTSQSDQTPLADMAGHGLNLGKNGSVGKFCEEHGYIIGIMSVMPKTAYQQGIPRHFLKSDKFDFFWPEFQHIGEQEIWQAELYAQTNQPFKTFGYIPRYSEYKYSPSSVHGYFRSSLDFWHLGRIFDNEPELNADFIEADPSNRIFAVEDPSEHKLIVHMFHNIKARRMMSYFGDPSFR